MMLAGLFDLFRRQSRRSAKAQSDALNLCEQGQAACEAGRTDEGIALLREAVRLASESPKVHYKLGVALQDAGQLEPAAKSYERAIELDPVYAEAHNNLGCVLHLLGDLGAALASYRRALDLNPMLPQANQNVAALTRDPAAAQAAIEGYERLAREHPRDPYSLVNLGNTYRELGRHRDAIDAFGRALERAPGLAEAHFARSLEQLLCGDYVEGWKGYEWRWKVKALNPAMPEFDAPVWDGAPIPGGAILLHAEQGFGDTLQFVRYARLVAERCATVVLQCQPSLEALMRSVAGVHRVLKPGEPVPRIDAHASLMSLPRLFGTTLETVPWHGPYIQADLERVARCDTIIPPTRGLRVGLVWAGQSKQGDDRKRSLSLAALGPLGAVPDIAFYSLQKGTPAAQASAPPHGMRLTDLDGHIGDFSDTAAFVSRLDLVITVDTSVAHLAGAMGRPTWVLLAAIPDWRYHLDRPDSPWYPSMRFFRQPAEGDWRTPVDKVASALAERAAGR